MAKNNFINIIDKLERQSKKESIKHGSKIMYGTVRSVNPLSIQIHQEDTDGEIFTEEFFILSGNISLYSRSHQARFTGILTGGITGHITKDGTITGNVTSDGDVKGTINSAGSIETDTAVNGLININGNVVLDEIEVGSESGSNISTGINGNLNINGEIETIGTFESDAYITGHTVKIGTINGTVTTDGEITGNVVIQGVFEGIIESETMFPILRIGDVVLLTSHSDNQRFLVHSILSRAV